MIFSAQLSLYSTVACHTQRNNDAGTDKEAKVCDQKSILGSMGWVGGRAGRAKVRKAHLISGLR